MDNDTFLTVHKEIPTRGFRAGKKSIITAIVLLVVLTVAMLILLLPAFYIKEIQIEGISVVSQEELLRSSGVELGDHIFSHIGGGIIPLFTFRYGNIEEVISSKYPYVQSIKIQVNFPSKIKITVKERLKIGYLEVPDGYAVIDKEGYVVEMSGNSVPTGVPLMEGLPVRSAMLGEKLDLSDDQGFSSSLTIFGAILGADTNISDSTGFRLMPCVKSIRYVGNSTTYLIIQLPESSKNLTIKIGSLKEISDDMTWLRYAIATNAFAGEVGDISGSVFDMTGDEYIMR
jgi:cell division protein FtsQ